MQQNEVDWLFAQYVHNIYHYQERIVEKLRIKLGSTRFYCDPDQAEYIFSEVLDFIIDHGLRFKLVD